VAIVKEKVLKWIKEIYVKPAKVIKLFKKVKHLKFQ